MCGPTGLPPNGNLRFGDDHDNGGKTVAIIGAGISGVITASVLREDGHDVTIFEANDTPGGVWRHAVYPGARLQNRFVEYQHPDLDWPFQPSNAHASAPEIGSYVDHCIESFGLKDFLKLNTKVVECDQQPDGHWKVTSKNLHTGNQEEQVFDIVLVAQGHYNENKANTSTWEGREIFEKAGGTVFTRHTFTEDSMESLANKRVAIVGCGKTALDLCQDVAEKSGAHHVHHVFRTPRWLFPSPLFCFHHTWYMLNRINSEMIPAWDYPRKSLRLFHELAAYFVWAFWSLVQTIIWYCIHYGPRAIWASPEIRQRLQMLRPSQHILMDHRAAAAICPPRYFDVIASGQLQPNHSGIAKFTESGLLLESGEHLHVDVVLLCTGNGSSPSTFPYLKKNGTVIDFDHRGKTDPRGLQLYRHLIHPNVSNLGYCGFNHGFLHCIHVYLGAIWLSCWMRNEIELPSPKEQMACIERMVHWKRQHVGNEPCCNEGVNTRIFYYNDILMMDLGLNPKRKRNALAEQIERYQASDYAGVLRAVQERRKSALAAGKEFRLKVVDRDM